MLQRRRDLATRFINGEELQARQLADEYGCTVRAIRGDLQVLKDAGLLEDNNKCRTYRAKEKYRKIKA